MVRHFKCFVLALFILTAGTAAAGTLERTESDALRADISALVTRFEAGDIDILISRTHPSLVTLVGGQQAYASMVRDAMSQLAAQGVTMVSVELGKPTPTYPAADEEVCFVPKVALMEIQGQRVRSTSFMIAIRSVAGGPWSYLDGAGLKNRPDLLHKLLPALQQGIELPPNRVELAP